MRRLGSHGDWGRDPSLGVPFPRNPVFGTDLLCHLPPRSDHLLDMGQVCAWCHDEIAGSDDRERFGRVSHGICRPCLTERLAALPGILRANPAGPDRPSRRLIRELEGSPLALA